MGYSGDFADPMRRFLLICLLILIPIGLATKMYTGSGSWWVYAHAGGVFYEIFWIFFVLAVWSNRSEVAVAAWVFLVTCILEFFQLWHPAPLEAIRGTFPDHAVLGSRFSWWDFPCYAVGCVIAVVIIRLVRLILREE